MKEEEKGWTTEQALEQLEKDRNTARGRIARFSERRAAAAIGVAQRNTMRRLEARHKKAVGAVTEALSAATTALKAAQELKLRELTGKEEEVGEEESEEKLRSMCATVLQKHFVAYNVKDNRAFWMGVLRKCTRIACGDGGCDSCSEGEDVKAKGCECTGMLLSSSSQQQPLQQQQQPHKGFPVSGIQQQQEEEVVKGSMFVKECSLSCCKSQLHCLHITHLDVAIICWVHS